MEVLVIVIFSLLAASMIALLAKKSVEFYVRVRKLKEEGALADNNSETDAGEDRH